MIKRAVMAPAGSCVYGVDPSTARASFAWVDAAGGRHVETVSFNPELRGSERLNHVFVRTFQHAKRLHARAPIGYASVEQPFGNPRPHPTSYHVQAMIMLAIVRASGALVESQRSPGAWKMLALGRGFGNASKPQILAWARAECGYTGNLYDEADALGIAVDASCRIALVAPPTLRSEKAL